MSLEFVPPEYHLEITVINKYSEYPWGQHFLVDNLLSLAWRCMTVYKSSFINVDHSLGMRIRHVIYRDVTSSENCQCHHVTPGDIFHVEENRLARVIDKSMPDPRVFYSSPRMYCE